MSLMAKVNKIKVNKIKIKRKKKTRIEDLPLPKTGNSYIEDIAKTLSRQIDKEILRKKYATPSAILKLVGTGAFLAASAAIPNLPHILKPLLNENEYEAWKRFNIPYLKRTLKRLEKQKLVIIKEEGNFQIVEITDTGRKRVLKYAINELVIEKPKFWDRKWRLISYDIPIKNKSLGKVFREYLRAWGFYPLHESVFLHAYPCEKQVEFLREYLGISEYVQIFQVSAIENNKLFKEFFGV